MTLSTARVGEVLELERIPVAPAADNEYVSIGIRSFGRGIFHYEPVLGMNLGKLRFYKLLPERLVLSNIKAWEGALALSTHADGGCIASNRFLAYKSRDERIDLRWAYWFFLSERGNRMIQRASPGSADRNRTLAIERFEALALPLPPIEEQRRVAARLDRTASYAVEVVRKLAEADRLTRLAVDRLVESAIDRLGWPDVELGEVAEINPGPDKIDPDQMVPFVPMAAVSEELGAIEGISIRKANDVAAGYKQFRAGDVIFARITPCMQNGKAAIFHEASHGYGSTEFHVIRPRGAVSADWIHRLIRTRRFRSQAAKHFTGTAGQQRVPATFLRTARIPIPPTEEQARAVASIDRIIGLGRAIYDRRERSLAIADSLRSSYLNQEFAASF